MRLPCRADLVAAALRHLGPIRVVTNHRLDVEWMFHHPTATLYIDCDSDVVETSTEAVISLMPPVREFSVIHGDATACGGFVPEQRSDDSTQPMRIPLRAVPG